MAGAQWCQLRSVRGPRGSPVNQHHRLRAAANLCIVHIPTVTLIVPGPLAGRVWSSSVPSTHAPDCLHQLPAACRHLGLDAHQPQAVVWCRLHLTETFSGAVNVRILALMSVATSDTPSTLIKASSRS